MTRRGCAIAADLDGSRDIKPLFVDKQTLTLRLLLLVLLSAALMVMDHRQHQLDRLREALSLVVFPVQVVADLPFSVAGWMGETLSARSDLLEENRRLRRRQLTLEARVQKLKALRAENARLRRLLGSAGKIRDRAIIAEIMRVDLDPYRQQILINRGRLQYPDIGDAALIDTRGIVGQITDPGAASSHALLLTDPNHSIPVTVNRNGLRTVARGTGETDRLDVPYMPNNADIREGDLLISSGLGGRFPRGYPVAEVTRVRRDPSARFADVSARPLADLDSIREVLLVWGNGAPPADADGLEATGGEGTEAAGSTSVAARRATADPAAGDGETAEPAPETGGDPAAAAASEAEDER